MRNIQPQTIIEIGSFVGISTIWMASGLKASGQNGVIHAIDLFYEIMPYFPYRCGYAKDPLTFAQAAVSSAQLAHRIHFYRMNSYEMGQHFYNIINIRIDLLYIDGDHSIRSCINDLALFSPYVSPGEYIALHDIYPEHCGYDGPRYIIDHFIKNSSFFSLIEIKTAPHNYGMAIIQKLKKGGNFYSGVSLTLDFIRAWARLKNTAPWQN
ncbi:MAG: class I SAM-dependent methyltransferase [Candidatus Hodarchaeota archaeon]